MHLPQAQAGTAARCCSQSPDIPRAILDDRRHPGRRRSRKPRGVRNGPRRPRERNALARRPLAHAARDRLRLRGRRLVHPQWRARHPGHGSIRRCRARRRMNVGGAWPHARTILAVRLDGMGDLLMTTPALRALKERPATRSLTLLTSPAGADVARELPFIDEVIPFTAPWMKSAEDEAVSAMAITALIDRLRVREFDAAVVFTVF